MDYDDLDTYDGDPVHGSRNDFGYNENTGELSDISDDSDFDKFIYNIHNWD